MTYVVKCDNCKAEIRQTASLRDSAAGGWCEVCAYESARKLDALLDTTQHVAAFIERYGRDALERVRA